MSRRGRVAAAALACAVAVDVHVGFQVVRLAETAAADVAPVRLVARVDLHVVAQLGTS